MTKSSLSFFPSKFNRFTLVLLGIKGIDARHAEGFSYFMFPITNQSAAARLIASLVLCSA